MALTNVNIKVLFIFNKISISLGFIPGGTANGLVMSILKYTNEEYSIETAAFIVAKGRTMRMDLTEIEGEY